VGAPSFAHFAKGGYDDGIHNGQCRTDKNWVGSIAAHPCKKRKDGATSVATVYARLLRRATRPNAGPYWIIKGLPVNLDSTERLQMRKGFTRKPKPDEPGTPVKNYITPSGLERLKDEHRFLLTRERPAVTEVVAWAASNGDRSENADYQYGKRRLRQIDGRIRFLTKRIQAAEVVDPEARRSGQAAARAFFGATVRYANSAGAERVVSIVGTDEIDLERNHISWVSPLARALMKSEAGDSVVLQLPEGTETLTVLEVRYERIAVEPFREPAGSEASTKKLSRRD
jgi:transcription elongation factor GreB